MSISDKYASSDLLMSISDNQLAFLVVQLTDANIWFELLFSHVYALA
jgi:hypothetical protein